jgi:predicted N-acetyltransferase YhbS
VTWRPPVPLAVQHHVRQTQTSGSARTFVAGTFGFTVGQVDTVEAPERIREGMGRFPLPVVILARLAVSRENHGRGIGVGKLQDAARVYTRFGFTASPLRQQQLLLLLKDARKILR